MTTTTATTTARALLSILALSTVAALKGTASLTYYISYAPCCPDNANYDPSADTTECDLYSACDYPGWFAALPDQKSYEWVASHDLISFFDSADASGSSFVANYGLKNITLVKDHTVIFNAWIVDTCGDQDCSGCCSTNAGANGFLVDLEYHTALRHFGDLSLVDGDIDFYIDEEYSPPTSEPTASICPENSHEFTIDSSW